MYSRFELCIAGACFAVLSKRKAIVFWWINA